MRETLINIYLDYYNNYLTYQHYASCNGLSQREAERLLDLARDIYNSPHPDA